MQTVKIRFMDNLQDNTNMEAGTLTADGNALEYNTQREKLRMP